MLVARGPQRGIIIPTAAAAAASDASIPTVPPPRSPRPPRSLRLLPAQTADGRVEGYEVRSHRGVVDWVLAVYARHAREEVGDGVGMVAVGRGM